MNLDKQTLKWEVTVYSAHIKPRKTIKTINTENIRPTHKHNMSYE